MNKLISPYIFLIFTIIFSVYSQIMCKWRISTKFSDIQLPEGVWDKINLIFTLVFDPFIFSTLLATFASGLCWMATMAKLDISFAYPFTSFGFVLVLLCSSLLLGESMNIYKVIGVLVIMLGILIASRG